MARPAEAQAAAGAIAPRRWRAEWQRFRALFDAPDGDDAFMRPSEAASRQLPLVGTHWVLWGTLALVVCLLVWAALGHIDQIAVGVGKVIPSRQVQKIQNLEGGIVSAILVEPGQKVERGQVLMQLDDTRFTSSFREGQAKTDTSQARIARLSAEAEGREFPATALQGLSAELVAEEQELFEARRRDLRTNMAVLREQEMQRRSELEEMGARERQLAASFELARRELELTRPLAAKGAVSEVELLRTERQTGALEAELEAARLSIPRLNSALAEARQKAQSYESQFRAKAAEELSKVRGEQTAQSAANVGLEDRVARTQIRAPVAGLIKQLHINTVGGVVQPGSDVVEIVPIEDTLLVEARVKPADIAFLKIGQPATVKLSAYDFSIYGGLSGKLEHISADTLMPEEPGEKREPYYRIRVRTDSARLSGWDQPVNILPGMEATVDIRTGRRTVMHYLLKPVIKTRERALREP